MKNQIHHCDPSSLRSGSATEAIYGNKHHVDRHVISFLAMTIVIFLILSSSPILAQGNTPITNSSQEITADVVEKIKDIVDKTGTSSATTDKILFGFAGTINSLTLTSLNLTTSQNITLQIATDNKTTYAGSSKTLQLKDLAVGGKVIVIGITMGSNDVILAKRIVSIPAISSPTVTRKVILGTIDKTELTKKTLTLTTGDKSTLLLNTTTKSTPLFKELITGRKLFAIYKSDTSSKSDTLLKGVLLP